MSNATLHDPALLVPPDPRQLFRRDDPHDPRLGEQVGLGPAAYAEAQVVLIGCPQDEGVLRNRGRPGAVLAPAAIRRCLWRLTTAGLEDLAIADLGDLQLAETLEQTHTRMRAAVGQALRDGKRVVVLGGGNDIAYPDCAAVADVCGPPVALNLDAHFDVRRDTPRNSGTPYRQLLDEELLRPSAFCELGSQPFANSRAYTGDLRAAGVTIHDRAAIRQRGIEPLIAEFLAGRREPAIFWGLDMDVVGAAEAPGVSAPNPLGISGAEFCQVAALAGAEPRTRLLEISEVSPPYDIDDRTARLAAVAIWHFLAAQSQITNHKSQIVNRKS